MFRCFSERCFPFRHYLIPTEIEAHQYITSVERLKENPHSIFILDNSCANEMKDQGLRIHLKRSIIRNIVVFNSRPDYYELPKNRLWRHEPKLHVKLKFFNKQALFHQKCSIDMLIEAFECLCSNLFRTTTVFWQFVVVDRQLCMKKGIYISCFTWFIHYL